MILYSYSSLQAEKYFREQNEKRDIKRIGSVAALGIIGYVILQTVLSAPLIFPALGELYLNNSVFQSLITIFLSVFSMLIPFGICGFYLESKTGADVFKFGKPVSYPLMITAVPLGFFVCLVGNYITSIFVEFMDGAGVTLTAPEFITPSDLSGRIVYAIAIAVVPAFVEEFAIRGAVMQPLRKYGDWFAIVASAIVFAVLHCNLIQAPFALIAGIGIGYAVCVTESLWTGVIIHFCNNFYAVLTEFMIADIPNEERLNKVYYITLIVLYAVSIIGSAVFMILKNKRTLSHHVTALTGGRKFAAFLLSVPMAIALLIMLYFTAQYVDFKLI